MELVWTCLSTIFTCVYVSVHIDVPDETKSTQFTERLMKRYEHSGKLIQFLFKCFCCVCRFTTTAVFRRVLWMLFNVFAPELVVFIAVIERMSAKDNLAFMRNRGQGNWTMRLAFFADMGGFELGRGMRYDGEELEEELRLEDGVQFLEWFDKVWVERKADFELDTASIEKDINDRSKQDIVVKLFTVCQASWLFVQCLVRLAEGRGVSELEVTTCAYIACTMITYGCWLHKPYGVQGRITLRKEMFQSPSDLSRMLTASTAVTLAIALPNERTRSHIAISEERRSAEMEIEIETTPLAGGEKEQATKPLPRPTKLDAKARYTPLNRAFFHPKKAWLCKSSTLPALYYCY